MKFERLGVFPYSNEEDTYAAINYVDDIPQEVKESRKEEIMLIQQGVSLDVNEKRVGEVLKIVIDRKEGDYYYGRTEFDSYEVDPEVLIPTEGNNLKVGTYYTAKINGFEDYDLFAEII